MDLQVIPSTPEPCNMDEDGVGREATAELLDEIKDISTSLTINAVFTGPWLADLAARMEEALTKYKEQTNEHE